jgi:hypothetical protein
MGTRPVLVSAKNALAPQGSSTHEFLLPDSNHPTLKGQSVGRPQDSFNQPVKGPLRCACGRCVCASAVIAALCRLSGACRAGMETAHRITGQPLHSDRRDDRQPRLPRRQASIGDRTDAAHWRAHRVHIRSRPSGSRPHLGRARQGAREISRHGSVPRRQPDEGRTYRRALGTGTQDHPRPFRPDWDRFKKAAPFRRNDQILEVLPKAVVACPGNGINANLVDKARKMGISVWAIE